MYLTKHRYQNQRMKLIAEHSDQAIGATFIYQPRSVREGY